MLNSDLKNDSASALSSTEVSSLKKQLRNIRDQVNKLLDSIDSTDNRHGGTSHAGMNFMKFYLLMDLFYFSVCYKYFVYLYKWNVNKYLIKIVWFISIFVIIVLIR